MDLVGIEQLKYGEGKLTQKITLKHGIINMPDSP
jgi:hypothetical protein